MMLFRGTVGCRARIIAVAIFADVGVDDTVRKQSVLDLAHSVAAVHLGYQWKPEKGK